MIKTIFGGIMVGIANIIPGVSGGTMMVILGLFDRIMESISNIFKKHNPNRLDDILFLGQVLLGAMIGLVGFASVIVFLLDNFKYQTMWWFSGLILCSIPTLKRSELRDHKINYAYLILGLITIALLVKLNPGKVDYDYMTLKYPDNNIVNLLRFLLVGGIAGATMLFPGISGSMVLLIIGQYYYFSGYIKSVTEFNIDKLIPLGFIFVGILLGIIISAKVTSKLIKSCRVEVISFIIGLIISSSLVLLPNSILSIHLTTDYNIPTIITCVISFVIGGLIIGLITKLQGKKTSV